LEADNLEKSALKAVLKKVLARKRLEEFSSLAAAAKDGDVDMVRTMLIRGADINSVDYDGRSALAMVMKTAGNFVSLKFFGF
jgi:hypothetical protein